MIDNPKGHKKGGARLEKNKQTAPDEHKKGGARLAKDEQEPVEEVLPEMSDPEQVEEQGQAEVLPEAGELETAEKQGQAEILPEAGEPETADVDTADGGQQAEDVLESGDEQKKIGLWLFRDKSELTDEQKKKQKIVMVIAIVAAVVMVLAAAVAVLYARWVQKPILPSLFGGSSSSAAGGDSNDPDGLGDPDYDPVQPKVSGERKSEDFYTVLVFGADETSGLTDTIMVVSYDVTNQKATIMSIPRDTLINSSATSFASKKINAVYKRNGGGEKGIEALKNEVSELVGFVPDYYVMIDWELVGQMVDAIGGVYFDIPYNMDYDDPLQNLYIHYSKGYQYLTGEDAMNVVRWRKNNKSSAYYGEGGGSDTNRLNVQHSFLKAVLKQTLQIQNLTKISQLAELFSENVDSDLKMENLYWFAVQAIMGGLDLDDVEFVTMPYSGGSYVKNGTSYSFVYPNQSQLIALINESLNPYVEDVTIKQLDLMSVTANGSLRSSTGVLADKTVGEAPAAASSAAINNGDDDGPVETDPVTTDSGTSQEPKPNASSQPTESEAPTQSSEPETSREPDVSSEPEQSGTELETTPEPAATEPAATEPAEPEE